MERRLAAILAADVVGYSRLMGADETGTLTALLTRRKDTIEPLIAGHRDRMSSSPLMRLPDSLFSPQVGLEPSA